MDDKYPGVDSVPIEETPKQVLVNQKIIKLIKIGSVNVYFIFVRIQLIIIQY